MTKKHLKDQLEYERVRAMLAGYLQAKRGERFSERMDAEDETLMIVKRYLSEWCIKTHPKIHETTFGTGKREKNLQR